MPVVLVALVVALALLVFLVRASTRVGGDPRRSRLSATEWLCEAVDADRERRLIVAASSFRLR